MLEWTKAEELRTGRALGRNGWFSPTAGGVGPATADEEDGKLPLLPLLLLLPLLRFRGMTKQREREREREKVSVA